jgi:hypothetical protein
MFPVSRFQLQKFKLASKVSEAVPGSEGYTAESRRKDEG